MKKVSLMTSLLLTLVMLAGFTAPALAEEMSTPLVVGDGNFSEKFSPFFSQTVYDGHVVSIVSISQMTLDRKGNIIWNGIDGETTAYGGKEYTYYTAANLGVTYDKAADIATYTCQLRDDMVFSDGVPVTADDLIFMYYVYADTDYEGSVSLNSYPIIGMRSYRTQTTDDVYDKYRELAEGIYAAGEDHVWSEADNWTQEQQIWFWEAIRGAWLAGVSQITEYVFDVYAEDFAEVVFGVSAAEVGRSEGLKVALGMVAWLYADLDDETGGLTGTATGAAWSMESGSMPSLEDFCAEAYAIYAGDLAAFWGADAPEGGDLLGGVRSAFIAEWGAKDEGMDEGGVPNIAGIRKVDDYTVEVRVQGYDTSAVYSILGNVIPPMHYYGDPDFYDYENNMFGFPRGDLSLVREKTTKPLGAGPYKYIGYENKVVSFEANELYWGGEPATRYLQLKETSPNEMLPGIVTGAIDVGTFNGSKKDFEQLAGYNGSGGISGDVIATSLVDNRGYGYIGMNAATVLVGEDPFSDASKNLRKALGTVFAAYRDVAYDSFYGEAAMVIDYPISNVIWAAPQPTDEGYKAAFSVDVEGNSLYAFGMAAEERYAIALEAAVGFLKAAGYSWDEAAGKFTEAPEGAKLQYEICIPGYGVGDHPSFAVATDAANALDTIGVTLKINDMADPSILWDMVDAGTQEIWTAAVLNGSPDPDMYQSYHSANIVGRGGTNFNSYHIDLPELDRLIIEGRTSTDQAYRRSVYKQALDIIVDAAVEVPCYQRQNAVAFSSQRIDMRTITPDITTWWDWINEIEKVEMKANQ